MTDIRSMADPSTNVVYYPQTHYQAVLELGLGVKNIIAPEYTKDLHSINESGLFYFDENTANKPEQLENGFLLAVFANAKNGVLSIMMTTNYYQKTNDSWSELQESQSLLKGGADRGIN